MRTPNQIRLGGSMRSPSAVVYILYVFILLHATNEFLK